MVAGYRELRDTQLCECNNGVLWSEAKGNWRYYAAWEFLYRLVKHEYNKRDSITIFDFSTRTIDLETDLKDICRAYLSTYIWCIYILTGGVRVHFPMVYRRYTLPLSLRGERRRLKKKMYRGIHQNRIGSHRRRLARSIPLFGDASVSTGSKWRARNIVRDKLT